MGGDNSIELISNSFFLRKRRQNYFEENVMSSPKPIEPNMVDISGARTSAVAGGTGKFASVYDGMSYAASIAGPVGIATAQTYKPGSAEIVAATVNAAAGYGGGMGMGMGGMSPGVYSGGAGAYYGGRGPSALNTPGTDPANSMLSEAQNQLANSQASSVAMLMVQDEMGQQNRFFTTASNLMNSRDTMLSSIIRNVRVG